MIWSCFLRLYHLSSRASAAAVVAATSQSFVPVVVGLSRSFRLRPDRCRGGRGCPGIQQAVAAGRNGFGVGGGTNHRSVHLASRGGGHCEAAVTQLAAWPLPRTLMAWAVAAAPVSELLTLPGDVSQRGLRLTLGRADGRYGRAERGHRRGGGSRWRAESRNHRRETETTKKAVTDSSAPPTDGKQIQPKASDRQGNRPREAGEATESGKDRQSPATDRRQHQPDSGVGQKGGSQNARSTCRRQRHAGASHWQTTATARWQQRGRGTPPASDKYWPGPSTGCMQPTARATAGMGQRPAA